MKDYKVGSRYNGLFVPRKIIEVEEILVDAGYVEELTHFNSPDRTARSYTTRIRHTEASAGQTVFLVHVHLIPRRDGDVVDPRGGVRGIIPSKQR